MAGNARGFAGRRASGMTLVGFILLVAVVGFIGVMALKVSPTVTEYLSVRKAIAQAKASGHSVREIQESFDRQADVGYIGSISGRDLEITKTSDGGYDVSFAYPKKIALFGPVSLLIEYEGSTASDGRAPKATQ
ncbi:MAG: DUF4845 domain-containing protein [Burkholderiaceae bacterium]